MLKKKPEAAKILSFRAKKSLDLRDYKHAREYIEKALSIEENNPDYLSLKGWIVFNDMQMPLEERFTISKKCYDQAFKANPDHADTLSYLAVYFREQKDTAAQKSYLEKCLKVNPQHKLALTEHRLMKMRSAKSSSERENPLKRWLKKLGLKIE